jgi:hypothetical protein
MGCHRDCLSEAVAAAIQTNPPNVAIAAPIAASKLTFVGSERNSATEPVAAPIVHKIAAHKFKTSALKLTPLGTPWGIYLGFKTMQPAIDKPYDKAPELAS